MFLKKINCCEKYFLYKKSFGKIALFIYFQRSLFWGLD